MCLTFPVARQERAVPLSDNLRFVRQRCSPCGVGRRSRVASLFFNDDMRKRNENRQRNYKYSFRLNEEQNLRFGRMLTEAGCEENRSRFIVCRIFGETFTVVRRDPSKAEFVARLNDFYYQFQRIGNNCAPVKVI